MQSIRLPISKSIANRLLLLQAIHGDELMPVSADMPDDVLVLHDALRQLKANRQKPITLNLKNSGTALRFLQVHLAKCHPGEPVTLTGDPRLMERDGKPTSQTTSALILHGEAIPYAPSESPYITMSRRMQQSYSEQRERSCSETVLQRSGLTAAGGLLEACWSSAAFWYEYIAIHGGTLLLEGLTPDSLQGDRVVADIYASCFGVTTTFTPSGACLTATGRQPQAVSVDFASCPDLYPAVALTCERLGIPLAATGTDNLPYKESDRLEAVRLHEIRNDHRMAMALIAADYIDPSKLSQEQFSDLRNIIAKSYPGFLETFSRITTVKANVDIPLIQHITPIRGVNDEGKGKKFALSRLIHAAAAEYLWLHDDDVLLPPVLQRNGPTASAVLQSLCDGPAGAAGLFILPLRMECSHPRPNLLERLQIAEYTALQQLTLDAVRIGHPVMCSGANLIVRRQVWLDCEPGLHHDIPSGDDMFLLEAVKHRKLRIATVHPGEWEDWAAVVRPVETWHGLWRQRTRWAGKAPHYTDRDIRLFGSLTLGLMLLQVICPPFWLVNLTLEAALLRRSPERNRPYTVWDVLLLSALYPFYGLGCLLGGMLKKAEW